MSAEFEQVSFPGKGVYYQFFHLYAPTAYEMYKTVVHEELATLDIIVSDDCVELLFYSKPRKYSIISFGDILLNEFKAKTVYMYDKTATAYSNFENIWEQSSEKVMLKCEQLVLYSRVPGQASLMNFLHKFRDLPRYITSNFHSKDERKYGCNMFSHRTYGSDMQLAIMNAQSKKPYRFTLEITAAIPSVILYFAVAMRNTKIIISDDIFVDMDSKRMRKMNKTEKLTIVFRIQCYHSNKKEFIEHLLEYCSPKKLKIKDHSCEIRKMNFLVNYGTIECIDLRRCKCPCTESCNCLSWTTDDERVLVNPFSILGI